MKNIDGINVHIKAWIEGVPVEPEALDQVRNVTSLPFIFKHVAVMPDVHVGMGATIGSVIPTKGAVIPSAVGVDIGCGMMAIKTTLTKKDIPEDKRAALRKEIERLVPTGRTNNGGTGDRGAWHDIPKDVQMVWDNELREGFENIKQANPKVVGRHGINHVNHLGTLGGGNHFIEICLDKNDDVWIMLHSGSRGVGNRIGCYFMDLAKKCCSGGSKEQIRAVEDHLVSLFNSPTFKALPKEERTKQANIYRAAAKKDKEALGVNLPNKDLAYFKIDTKEFNEYLYAVLWAQRYAKINRLLMKDNIIKAVTNICGKFGTSTTVNCHHNYVGWEKHFDETILVTRKGAISAQKEELGIIPGSMGDKSYIVSGLGNKDSFCSASHGAGRLMSRKKAREIFTVEDHETSTSGVECEKSISVIDETPLAYKDINAVINAESDLVKVVDVLKQIICIKG